MNIDIHDELKPLIIFMIDINLWKYLW